MTPPTHERDSLPRGLVFFSPRAGRSYRTARLAFLVFYLALGLCLVGPVYTLFSRIEPYVLGLPFSFAWVVVGLLAGFAGLLALYFFDGSRAASRRDAPTEEF